MVAGAKPGALKIFWDVDAAATLDEMRAAPDHPVRRALPALDMVLTYGGGPPVVDAYRGFGAKLCEPVYNALDPATHHPAPADPKFASDLAFLGNRLPDRETRVEEFFLKPAAMLADRSFLIGGNGWDSKPMPGNVRHLGHVYTAEHNAFNCTPLAVLNVARDSMAHVGFSPATRVFEAAGAGACLITDQWEGIELFLKPDEEVLVARDGQDVADLLAGTSPDRAARIARQRRQALTGPQQIDCDDAPVSSIETMAEVRARLARRLDPVYAARAAVEALPERQRVELIGELLCSLRGARAKDHLARTRNLITSQLHRLITSEYDAEVAARPGLMAPEIARPEGPAPASSPSLTRRSPAGAVPFFPGRVPSPAEALPGPCRLVVHRPAPGPVLVHRCAAIVP